VVKQPRRAAVAMPPERAAAFPEEGWAAAVPALRARSLATVASVSRTARAQAVAERESRCSASPLVEFLRDAPSYRLYVEEELMRLSNGVRMHDGARALAEILEKFLEGRRVDEPSTARDVAAWAIDAFPPSPADGHLHMIYGIDEFGNLRLPQGPASLLRVLVWFVRVELPDFVFRQVLLTGMACALEVRVNGGRVPACTALGDFSGGELTMSTEVSTASGRYEISRERVDARNVSQVSASAYLSEAQRRVVDLADDVSYAHRWNKVLSGKRFVLYAREVDLTSDVSTAGALKGFGFPTDTAFATALFSPAARFG